MYSNTSNNQSVYQTIDSSQFSHAVPDQESHLKSKKTQMISSIMDTIEQKSGNLEELKKSLKGFDEQLLALHNTPKRGIHPQTSPQQPITNRNSFNDSKSNYHHISNNNQNDSMQKNSNYNQNDYLNQVMNPSYLRTPSARSHSQYNLAKPSYQSTKKLSVPKPNTLTDKFMKHVLGSEQQLIEQYKKTVNPLKYQQQVRRKLINTVREEWRKSATIQRKNNPTNHLIFGLEQKITHNQKQTKAFYDENYYTYLKTNIQYLNSLYSNNNNSSLKLKSNILKSRANQNTLIYPPQQSFPQHFINYSNIDDISSSLCSEQHLSHFHQKDSSPFYERDPQKIAKKIQQTGGIQNTIQKMEKSLKKNELKHLKANQFLQKKSINIKQRIPLQQNLQKKPIVNQKVSQSKISYIMDRTKSRTTFFFENRQGQRFQPEPEKPKQQLALKISVDEKKHIKKS